MKIYENGLVLTINLTKEMLAWIDDRQYTMFFSRSEFFRYVILQGFLNHTPAEKLPDANHSELGAMKIVTLNIPTTVLDYMDKGGNRCANCRALARLFIESQGFEFLQSGAIIAKARPIPRPQLLCLPNQIQVGEQIYTLGRRVP